MNQEYLLSDPIECIVDGTQPTIYSLYLSTDLAEYVYQGKVYPRPDYPDKAVITLNDIIKNYVSFDGFNMETTGWTSVIGTLNMVQYKVLTTWKASFTLVTQNGVSTPITYNFDVQMAYKDVGDNTSIGNISEMYQTTANNRHIPKEVHVDLPNYLVYRTPETGTSHQINYFLYKNGVKTYTGVIPIVADPNTNIILKYTPGLLLQTGYEDKLEMGYCTVDPDYIGQSAYYYNLTYGFCAPDYTLFYFNRYGGVDSIATNDVLLKSDMTNTEYKINYRKFDGTQMTGDINNQGTVRTNIVKTTKYEFITRYLNDYINLEIEDLYYSPKLWLFRNGTNKYISVLLYESSYKQQTFRKDKMNTRTLSLTATIQNKIT